MPTDVEVDLRKWLHTLLTFQPTRLMPNPAPTEIGWVGDASTSFGIGILIGSRWSQFQLRQIYQDPAKEEIRIARLETIAICLGICMLEVLGIKKGKTFIVWTDNTTTKGVVRKRKSNDQTVNKEWKKIRQCWSAYRWMWKQDEFPPRRIGLTASLEGSGKDISGNTTSQ
jgi:hypothetical protein